MAKGLQINAHAHRLIPVAGGNIKVLAYFYCGRGAVFITDTNPIEPVN